MKRISNQEYKNTLTCLRENFFLACHGRNLEPRNVLETIFTRDEINDFLGGRLFLGASQLISLRNQFNIQPNELMHNVRALLVEEAMEVLKKKNHPDAEKWLRKFKAEKDGKKHPKAALKLIN
jgi:hypothetical protein